MRAIVLSCSLLAFACTFDAAGRCATNDDCTPGLSCSAGVCSGCASSAECQSWQSCTPQRLCLNQTGRCTASKDCTSWETCDAGHSCVLKPGACYTGSDCNSWETCDALHACSPQPGRCTTDAHCTLAPSCTADHYCAFPPGGGDVLLFGTLSEGACGLDALSRLETPETVSVGMDCKYYQGAGKAVLTPTGQVRYPYGITNDQLRTFVADPFVRDSQGSWTYPTNPNANDPIAVSTACPTDVTGWVFQAGTGAVMYGCRPASGNGNDYYDETGTKKIANQRILSWNQADYKVIDAGTYNYSVLDPAGVTTAVTGLGGRTQLDAQAYRAQSGGFWIAFRRTGMNAELFAVDNAGTATLVGTYAALPNQTSAYWSSGAVLDSAGNLYELAVDQRGQFTVDCVVRLPFAPDPAIIVYSELNAPTSNWTTSPYNRIHISQLVTSP